MTMPSRNCERCGTDFTPARGQQRFCGAGCRMASTRERTRGKVPIGSSLTCPGCGEAFSKSGPNQTYCAASCSREKDRRALQAQRIRAQRETRLRERRCAICGDPFMPGTVRSTTCRNPCTAADAGKLRQKDGTSRKSGVTSACEACGVLIESPRRNQRFCSSDCRDRDGHLSRKYSISTTEYRRMLEGQDGKCAICHRPFTNRLNPMVDHIEGTTTVRGLLCLTCNAGIGLLRHDPAVIRSAIAYLDAHPTPAP